jgi:serine/threonine protein kinase
MLFGRYPFCDRTLVGLFIKIGRCRPDIPRTISLKARSLLRCLIRVKPDERLLTQDILGHVWFVGEQAVSSISIATNVNNTIVNDDLTLLNNHPHTSNANCTSQSDLTAKDDAVVPNFECE